MQCSREETHCLVEHVFKSTYLFASLQPCPFSMVIFIGVMFSMPKNDLLFTQNAAVYSTRVHALGRYVFILHYHQPLHPTYPVQVYINGGRIWQGENITDVIEVSASVVQEVLFI